MSDSPPLGATLRVLWRAVFSSAALLIAVLAWLSAQQPASRPDLAETAFYAAAATSVLGTAAAFWLLRRRDAAIRASSSGEEARLALQSWSLFALVAAEVPVLVAALAAFLTGEWLTLAFVVPFVAFAALSWPSEARVAGVLAQRRR